MTEPDDRVDPVDPRGIDEPRKAADSQFPMTRRTAFYEWFDRGELDRLWEELFEIYYRPLAHHYERFAGSRQSFPRVPGLTGEDLVDQYFASRVRRNDFVEGSWYGKWLRWRQASPHSQARHLRHWIKEDFRNYCRDAAKAGWRREKRERGFMDFEADAIDREDLAVDVAEKREEDKAELAGVVQCAIDTTLQSYAEEKREKILVLFRAIYIEDKRYGEVVEDLGIGREQARAWMTRFRKAAAEETQRLLRSVGYDDDDVQSILETI